MINSTRLFYVDDSGAESTGYVVYSWVECDTTQWRAGALALADLRAHLHAKYQIPVSAELHATQFISGRGNPSQNPGVNLSKAARHAAAEDALSALGRAPGLQVGTVFRRTLARRRAYAVERDVVYAELVECLDKRMRMAGGLAIILMDGDGTATGYYGAHRRLSMQSRQVIEDPLFVPAHRSAFVQAADFAAWTAYQSLLRHGGKEFAWHWYEKYLGDRDVNGGPVEL
ncbi:DUF3800 domain-containing protein [Amycolatopsis sp. cg5]|uniref:DUF3800 domain-containing protein n=1 Tax=Amycolatopsis sp. cg5 TaxID=3238802 RepID=UPI00352373DB